MYNNPKVSIIIPVWNPGEGITRCVESLRSQTLRDIEMIFVDDCGTDGAMDVVRKAAAEDPRIRIITNAENVGPGPSRNVGIEAARGEYLSFVDADDFIDRDFLEILYEKGKTENLDIVKGNYCSEKGHGLVCSVTSKQNDAILAGLEKGEPLFLHFRYQFQSAIFRNNLFASPDIRFGLSANAEDITFLLKACYAAKSFGIDNRVAYHYVYRETSGSISITKVRLDGRIAALREQSGFLANYVEPDPYAKQYLLKRVKYYLSLARYVANTVGMKEEAAQFLADLRSVASDYLAVDIIKKDVVIFALVNYGEGLSEYPYHRVWSSPSVEAYMDVFTSWVDFLTTHPEQYRRLPIVFDKAKHFEEAMMKERKSPGEIKWFKSQVKGLLHRPAILKMRIKNRIRNSKLGHLWIKFKNFLFK